MKAAAVIGLVAIGLLAAAASGDPLAIDLDRALLPPANDLSLGTDHLGRDLGARIAAGTMRSMAVVAIVAVIAVPCGIALGLSAALYRPLETPLMLVLRMLTAIPLLVLALAATAFLGLSPVSAGLAIGASTAAQYALVTSGHARACLREPYVQAAVALGAGRQAIAWRHVLPTVNPPLRTHLGSDLARALIAYAGLAFIGLGADTGSSDWGAMAWEYRAYIFEAPRLVLAPIVATTALALVIHLMLDASRKGLTPSLCS